MEKLELDQALEKEIMSIRRESSGCLKEKDFTGVVKFAMKAWELIPEPKKQYSESFLVARMMCEGALGLKDEKLSELWTEVYATSALHRIDSGERDFMKGRFYFTYGNYAEAKTCFAVADKKSDGRLFKSPENAEYYLFYKKK